MTDSSQQQKTVLNPAAETNVFANVRSDTTGFGRNTEAVMANQLTSHITPCSTTPAVVAQALSGMQSW